jgi:hypothetical protein
MVPANWTTPSQADLAVWYIQKWNNSDLLSDSDEYGVALRKWYVFPYGECSDMVCQELKWNGDPDVTGTGMMASYYLAASFATIYFVVLVAGGAVRHFTRRKKDSDLPEKQTRRRAFAKRFLAGFTETPSTVLDSALIFATAMLAASLYRYSSFFRHREREFSSYSLNVSALMSMFSIYTALVLQSLANGQRGHLLRQVLWFMVGAYLITASIMFGDIDLLEFDAANDLELLQVRLQEILWQGTCEEVALRRDLDRTIGIAGPILWVYVFWWLYYVLDAVLPPLKKEWIKQSRIGRLWGRVFPFLCVISGLVACALMWIMLGLFQGYRTRIQRRTHSKEGQWSFGQVLALATWAPVLVDLIAVWACKSPYFLRSTRMRPIVLIFYFHRWSRRWPARKDVAKVYRR